MIGKDQCCGPSWTGGVGTAVPVLFDFAELIRDGFGSLGGTRRVIPASIQNSLCFERQKGVPPNGRTSPSSRPPHSLDELVRLFWIALLSNRWHPVPNREQQGIKSCSPAGTRWESETGCSSTTADSSAGSESTESRRSEASTGSGAASRCGTAFDDSFTTQAAGVAEWPTSWRSFATARATNAAGYTDRLADANSYANGEI